MLLDLEGNDAYLCRDDGAVSEMYLNQSVAMVDQETSMLDLVKSGAGLSLVREQIALREAQAHGLVIADQVSLDCVLSFVCLKSRTADPVVATALGAIDAVWRRR